MTVILEAPKSVSVTSGSRECEKSKSVRSLVRAAGIEPARGYPQRIFVPATAFAAPPSRSRASAGSWSGLSLHPAPAPNPSLGQTSGFRCCPSSLYTFPFPGLARDCHLTGSPEFGQFYIAGFPGSTQVGSKSVASTSFATPAYHGMCIAAELAAAKKHCTSN